LGISVVGFDFEDYGHDDGEAAGVFWIYGLKLWLFR